MHKWYAATACPGPYLGSKFPELARRVNEKLGPGPVPPTPSSDIHVGDVIKIKSGAKYTTGETIPSWVLNSTIYCREFCGDNIVFSLLKTGDITGSTHKSNCYKA